MVYIIPLQYYHNKRPKILIRNLTNQHDKRVQKQGPNLPDDQEYIINSKNLSSEDIDDFNREAQECFNLGLNIKCKFCKNPFRPGQIKQHEKQCKLTNSGAQSPYFPKRQLSKEKVPFNNSNIKSKMNYSSFSKSPNRNTKNNSTSKSRSKSRSNFYV